MSWVKLAPWAGDVHHGCFTCGGTERQAPMDMLVSVGFGSCCVMKGAEEIWSETMDADQECYDLEHFEALAAADPDHDWQVSLQGPLRGRTYQRHGEKLWVLVESNEGFA